MNSVLKGKVFISTRPYGKSKELSDLLNSQEASLYELPMIELTYNDRFDDVNEILNILQKHTHIAFTSASAFAFFYHLLSKSSALIEILNHLKIVSIGYKTSECIKEKGLLIDFDAQAKTGKEFANKLAIHLQKNKARVLWPTGNLSPNYLVDKLELIAPVYRLNIYQNEVPKKINKNFLTRIEKGEYDMIIIASPSAFNNLITLVSNKTLNIICIGSTSATSVLKGGTKPLAIAKEPTALGIYNALENYYSKNLLTK